MITDVNGEDRLFRTPSLHTSATSLAGKSSVLAQMGDWTQDTSTQAQVKVAILDNLWQTMPTPPYSERDPGESRPPLRVRLAAPHE